MGGHGLILDEIRHVVPEADDGWLPVEIECVGLGPLSGAEGAESGRAVSVHSGDQSLCLRWGQRVRHYVATPSGPGPASSASMGRRRAARAGSDRLSSLVTTVMAAVRARRSSVS